MRHKVKGKKLNRDTKQRKALFKNLVESLIIYGKIKTTIAKAKAIRRLVEKIVTIAKSGSDNANRQLMAFLNKNETSEKLKNDIVPGFKDKLGGYLKIVRLGKRQGDAAEEVILQWSHDEKEVKSETKIKEIKEGKKDKPKKEKVRSTKKKDKKS